MNSLSAIVFRKQVTCPSSEILLACRTTGGETTQREWVATHLEACEFCNAELQLLGAHPPTHEDCPIAEMPLHLRYLAVALLARHAHAANTEIFVEPAYEKEPA